MTWEDLREADMEIIACQLGRKPRGRVFVASRCPHGVVQVIANSPFLEDKIPFPTLYWLTCPRLRREIARMESGDFREAMRLKVSRDSVFARELEAAEEDYAREREELARALVGEEGGVTLALKGGIGGSRPGSLKCLHSHYAQHLARGNNPIGREMEKHLARIGREMEKHLARVQIKCPGKCG